MGKETSGRTVRPLVREDLSWLLPLDAGSFAEAWTEDTWGDELEGRLSHYIALEEMGVPVAFGGLATQVWLMRILAITQDFLRWRLWKRNTAFR